MKRLRLFLVPLTAATVICCSGCATVFSGARQEISVESQPSGAEVWLNGDFAGTTPCRVELDQRQHPLFILKKDGFADTRVRIERATSGYLALNTPLIPLFGVGLLTLSLDSRAGTEKTYAETEIIVPLLLPGQERAELYGGNVILTNESGK